MDVRTVLVCFYIEIVIISAVTVDRQTQDAVYVGSNDCHKIYGQSKFNNSQCMCNLSRNDIPQYTFMSKSGKYTQCNGPEDLRCHIHLDSKKPYTYLIDKKNTYITVTDYNIFYDSITQVLVWNLKEDKTSGRWHPLPDDLVKKLFKVSWSYKYGDYSSYKGTLSATLIDLKVWSGHLVKVSFGEVGTTKKEACVTIKYKGEVKYPFDWEKFINDVRGSFSNLRLLLLLVPLIPIASVIIMYHLGLFADLCRKKELSGNENANLMDYQEQENCEGNGDVIDMAVDNEINDDVYTGTQNNNQGGTHRGISDCYRRNGAEGHTITEVEEDIEAYQASEVGKTSNDYEDILRRCDDVIARSIATNHSTDCVTLNNKYGDVMAV